MIAELGRVLTEKLNFDPQRLIEAGIEVLASGDWKHLLPVGERGGVWILTPQALLAELRGD